jgi:hypothetical protein
VALPTCHAGRRPRLHRRPHRDVPTAKAFEAERNRAGAGFAELIARAKAAQDTWRRLVAYLLQSFAAEAAAPLPDPPTPAQMYRAMLRLQPRSKPRAAARR